MARTTAKRPVPPADGEAKARGQTRPGGQVAFLQRALDAVDAIAAEVARTRRLEDLLPAVLRTVIEGVGADAGVIRLLTPDGTALAIAASQGIAESFLRSRARVPADDTTMAGRALRTGQIQAVASDDESPGVSAEVRALGFKSILSAPLAVDGWPVGTIGVSRRAPGDFTEDERRVLTIAAHHLATAAARAQLFEDVARGKAEWERLFDAMPDGVALCGHDGRLRRVNRTFAELHGGNVAAWTGASCPLGVPHTGRAEAGREIPGSQPGQRLLVNTFPLDQGDGESAALFHVVHDVTAERAAAEALRRQNALLEEARAEAELFGEIAHSIAASLRLEEVLDRIVEAGRRFTGVDLCGLKLPNGDEATLAGTAMSGGRSAAYRASRTPLDEPYASSLAWRERRSVIVEDYHATTQFRRDLADRQGIRSALYVPLLGPQGPLGVMIFGHTDRPRPITPETVRRAERLAAHAALAIENARLHRELAEHAARLEERVRERTEALERVSRHKSDFLAHMSHELRTPLNGILGFSSMLLEGHGGPLTDKERRYASQIQQSGQHLLALINDVLDLSKVEAGRLALQRERVTVSVALTQAIDLMRGLAAARGVSVTAEVSDPAPVLHADPMRLHQVITNLLSNAIKFTPAGGQVTVRAARTQPDAADSAGGRGLPGATEWVEIVVTDTGIGIDPQDIHRLFRPFEQLENRPRRSHEGTGLGLALTQHLVELHGGRIWAESPGVGRGSTFTVAFPAGAGPPQRTVAVVDDDPHMVRTLVEALRKGGYRTLEAGTAADAARLLAARPDLLILDLALPDRPGEQFLADLRADPATRDLPVLVITGITQFSEADLRRAGADEFLTKPFSPTVLLDAAARLLAPAAGAGRTEA